MQLAQLPIGAIFQSKDKHATATATIAADGTIEITANCDSLTLLINSYEKEVYRLKKVQSELKTTINKEKTKGLSGWQNFQVWCGRIAMGLLIVYLIFKGIKKRITR